MKTALILLFGWLLASGLDAIMPRITPAEMRRWRANEPDYDDDTPEQEPQP